MAKIEVKLNPDVLPSGSDLAVVNAARRSFNTRSQWEVVNGKKQLAPKDVNLINFLVRGMQSQDFFAFIDETAAAAKEGLLEKSIADWDLFVDNLWKWRNTPVHDTPFNHCFISFEVKAPIFVSRQLVKHEYLIMSEFSRRYITDNVEFYEPEFLRQAAPNKKQGSINQPVEHNEGLMSSYSMIGTHALGNYKALLDNGVAPEQARSVLPQFTMTEWTWSGTLGAFAKMCSLRLHQDAQHEAKLVAQKIYSQLLWHYPVSARALIEGV